MKYLMTTAAVLCATAAWAETPVLKVYTYDSFVSDWGPGPAVEAAFEETCGCDLQFVGAGDGAALLARLKLEGARSDADIVLGLDTNLLVAAKETGLFAAHCESCHGEHARGSNSGPTLIHSFYEPNLHGDSTFYDAIRHGAYSHHWNFGDMPAIDGIKEGETAAIVAYVRKLQFANGLRWQ